MEFIKKLFGPKNKGPDLSKPSEVIEALVDGKLAEVSAAIAAQEAKLGSKRGGYDWTKGMPPFLFKQAEQFTRRKFPDLPGFTATQQKRVGSALAFCVMAGTPKTEVPAIMRSAMGGHFFECVELSEFCNQNPCGTYVVRMDKEVLYWSTRLAEVYNSVRLEEIKAEKRGDGIQIITIANDPCRLCKTNKLVFLWRDMADLPTLPRHWGCRCTYEAFVRQK